ncbi:hypothetical protein [Trinickia acidisoli]|uniref:hypothetical protein n=1 Tax=Trinickia acidisoli TaxID=2767482 RepID=UPI001A8DBCFC|nr:hypothetical protein [Trinickia acidisoli]
MTFELPNLDVLQAGPVLDRLVRRIPGYAPGWTDHNPSDPGIALLQMLVWLCEGTAYTANAVPFETYRNMLRWVVGLSSALALPQEQDYATAFPYAAYADTGSQDPAYEVLKETLEQVELGAVLDYGALQEALVALRRAPFLAVTPADLSALTVELSGFVDAQAQGGTAPLHVARLCLQQRDEVTELMLVNDAASTYSAPTDEGGGTFSTSLASPVGDAQFMKREATLLDQVRQYFAARTLLGSAMSIEHACLHDVYVQCEVRCFARERVDEVATAVLGELDRALQPIRSDGGRDWAYGAGIDAATVLPIIAAAPGVDRVQNLNVSFIGHPIVALGRPLPPDGVTAGLPRLYCARVTALEASDG